MWLRTWNIGEYSRYTQNYVLKCDHFSVTSGTMSLLVDVKAFDSNPVQYGSFQSHPRSPHNVAIVFLVEVLGLLAKQMLVLASSTGHFVLKART